MKTKTNQYARFSWWMLCVALGLKGASALACDLCAVYSASNARGENNSGFLFSVAQQYIAADDLRLNGQSISVPNPEYLDSSITHLVPGYNFSPNFGVSLNVPYIYRWYRLYNLTGAEQGTVSGFGDMSLIARWSPLIVSSANFSAQINILGGVKFPTGDAEFVAQSVEQERLFNTVFPPGHDHAISGVHPYELALGSGSYDGIFGTTGSVRWGKFFLNTEVQYYLRTEGESSFEFGDELMVSGGPGYYLFLKEDFSVSLQANAVYDLMGRVTILGQKSNQSGMEVVYLGPNIVATLGSHFSAQAGVDIPLWIDNNGLQSVPSYRIHGGFSWSF